MPIPATKKNLPPSGSLRDEILGLVLIALAVFCLASLVSSDLAIPPPGGRAFGAAGRFTVSLLQAVAGRVDYGIPLLLAFRGWQLVRDRCRGPLSRAGWGIILAYLGLLVAANLSLVAGSGFVAALKTGISGQGGGLIGAGLAWLLNAALGLPGSYIVLVTVFLASFVLVTQIPLRNLGQVIAVQLSRLFRAVHSGLISFLFIEEEDEKAGGAEPSGEGNPKAEDPEGRARTGAAKASRDHGAEIRTSPAPGHRTHEPEEAVDRTFLEAVTPEDGAEERPEVTADGGGFVLPPISLLPRPHGRDNNSPREDNDRARLLEETLDSFGVKVEVTNVSHGPTVTRYEVHPAPGVKVSRIVSLADDIALSLAAPGVRIEAPIPGKAALGIEVPNHHIAPVHFREVLECPEFQRSRSKLTIALGKDIAGTPVIADLSRMPHLLIAGATGSGKSVCLNALICSMLFKGTPGELRFLLIDPKRVELAHFNHIPHLLTPVITDPKKAAVGLRWMVTEMENRYQLFATAGARDIASYNRARLRDQSQSTPSLPLYVIVIDELADLMMVSPVEIEESICRLAQMARAAGIHLVVATQRPSVDVITGLIKANIPSRVAFAVSSQVDSRTILDMAGAEKLLGRGDMLFLPVGAPKPVRLQGVYVADSEVEKVVGFLRTQKQPEYVAGITQGEIPAREEGSDDELLPEAVRIFLESGQASISLLQRRLRIGYARAARLVDLMESRGIVGAYEGSKARSLLIDWDDYHRLFGNF